MKHTPIADPFNDPLRQKLAKKEDDLKLKFHSNGTVITIEEPRFSTRAESKMFCLWGADMINMSVATECILANELGIPCAAVTLIPGYDCLKTHEEPVTLASGNQRI